MNNIKRFVYALERHLDNNFIKNLARLLDYDLNQLEKDIRDLIAFIDSQE